MLTKLVSEFGEADVQKNKLVFIAFCEKALVHLSTKTFKDHLLPTLLRFPYDKRSQVRKHFL